MSCSPVVTCLSWHRDRVGASKNGDGFPGGRDTIFHVQKVIEMQGLGQTAAPLMLPEPVFGLMLYHVSG